MTIMVDDLMVWPGPKPRCFAKGSCHLTTDEPDLERLHSFAAELGLKREWFQDHRIPHYDLTPAKRQMALDMGAVFVPGKEQARRRIAARETNV